MERPLEERLVRVVQSNRSELVKKNRFAAIDLFYSALSRMENADFRKWVLFQSKIGRVVTVVDRRPSLPCSVPASAYGHRQRASRVRLSNETRRTQATAPLRSWQVVAATRHREGQTSTSRLRGLLSRPDRGLYLHRDHIHPASRGLEYQSAPGARY